MMTEEKRFGRNLSHLARPEPPDVLVLIIVGDVLIEDARVIMDALVAFGQGRPLTFALVDLSRMGTMSLEARKHVAHTQFATRHGGTAVFGAGLVQRMLASLVVRAYNLIHPNGYDIAFFDSEAAARAWIDQQRRKLTGTPCS
ncbi:uncharacterized protein SOCE26_031560 [Sorangium cellulosum]|uniref:STAS/SEC14 domain-containing protein n=1 Tax=Sorangium cellulosum TaxID=56 RepID=A0A2L0ER04_SORCE|nr:STAS/SEC14 domain-containing protein [Sorangium cellulosum]AUX41733.1 uncharacterized protein SOCE26_031560 [Sorangium cellulosum]